MTVLTQAFFDRCVLNVSQDLLGKQLCRRLASGEIIKQRISEVEAYDGTEDKACHACKGKTKRNAVMFGPAGVWYVYLCYGMHWMLNVVTGAKDYPAAVLIRGTHEVIGPGRLTKSLAIDNQLDGKRCSRPNGLWIEDDEYQVTAKSIARTPRIGIQYAGPVWVKKPYRFLLKNDLPKGS